MKKFILVFLLVFSYTNGKMFQSVSSSEVVLVQKGDSKNYCPNCGMNLTKFYKTNHIHKNHQYCSIHCLLEANHNILPKNAKVIDSKKLIPIDVKDAYYVVGSKKKGTMSKNSKYAFSSKSDALEFANKNGGKIYNFEQTYNIAKKDFKKDMMMINNKRVKKAYKMGKKLYNKTCQKDKINLNNFEKISDLKAYINTNKICKVKKDKQLQVISIYLWDIVKLNKSLSKDTKINVPKDAKCQICGMFVSKYPKWAAKIKTKNHTFYFDGVKDMMKWHLKQNNQTKNIFVSDYYTTNKIDAISAYYVIGSNVYGPMGNELIPFKTKEDAKEFMLNHNGKKIIKFNQISKSIIDSL